MGRTDGEGVVVEVDTHGGQHTHRGHGREEKACLKVLSACVCVSLGVCLRLKGAKEEGAVDWMCKRTHTHAHRHKQTYIYTHIYMQTSMHRCTNMHRHTYIDTHT